MAYIDISIYLILVKPFQIVGTYFQKTQALKK